MKANLPALAGDRIRQRRLSLGLSETGLSRSLGVSPMTVRRVEEGGTPVNYDLRFIAAYAAALGLEFADMFDISDLGGAAPDGAADDDPATVGAVLAASGGRAHIDALATALGWTLERTRLALDDLEPRVRAAGMRLVWFADTEVLLAPADGHDEVTAAHLSRAVEVAGVNVTEFHVIRQLAQSGPVKHWAGSDARLLARLVAAGLVRAGRTGATGHKGRQRTEVALTDRTLYDLCLDESAGR